MWFDGAASSPVLMVYYCCCWNLGRNVKSHSPVHTAPPQLLHLPWSCARSKAWRQLFCLAAHICMMAFGRLAFHSRSFAVKLMPTLWLKRKVIYGVEKLMNDLRVGYILVETDLNLQPFVEYLYGNGNQSWSRGLIISCELLYHSKPNDFKSHENAPKYLKT